MSDMSDRGVILIVDDMLTNLEVLFACLTDAGFRILVAEDGEGALQKAKYALPDLILLDILMPEMDGFETCRRLKADAATAGIPVIFMTALTETADKIKGFSLGAVDYITKPFQQEEVLARVQTHISLQLLTRRLQDQNQRLAEEIQERQRKEAALCESEERFRLLVEGVKDYAIVMLDPDGLVVSWNSGAERIKGYQAEEIIGRSFACFYPAEKVQQGHPQKLLEIAKTKGQVEDEGWRVRKDGTRFWTDVVITALWKEGRLWGFSKVTRDITERKKAQQILERQHQELVRSNIELQQFAYIASHDLQEPLRMVTSYLQLLQLRYKEQLDQNANDFIGYAVDGATRMRTLINDLLVYSRVGTRGKPFALTDCDQVMQEAIANLKVTIADQEAIVTWDGLPKVIGDATQLTQLFQNLISNAIKFHRSEPPAVHIVAERQEQGWLFAVQDNGIGIEPQYAERIFEIFQRLHHRTDYPGTGIGLAICRKIVERHGGKIWIESEASQGTTFYFTIADSEKTESDSAIAAID